MFSTIAHQTVQDRNGPDYIEENGPFWADTSSDNYLGHGCYFWDDNIGLAHWWGQKHFHGNYVICRGELNVKKDVFLDLVGSRQDLIYFEKLLKKLNMDRMPIGRAIEFLKNLNKRPGKNGVFPFEVVRAVDLSSNSYDRDYQYFTEGKPGLTSLDPAYIICIFAQSRLHLSDYIIIYPEEYISK